MAIVRIDPPNQVPAETADWQRMLQMVDGTAQYGTRPSAFLPPNKIREGSIFYVRGVLYRAESDTVIAGTGIYIRFTVSTNGAEIIPDFTNDITDVSWDNTYNGWYDSQGRMYLLTQNTLQDNYINASEKYNINNFIYVGMAVKYYSLFFDIDGAVCFVDANTDNIYKYKRGDVVKIGQLPNHTGTLHNIAYLNGKYFAVFTDAVYSSDDLTLWVQLNITGSGFNNIYYFNDYYFIVATVGTNSPFIFRSNDGVVFSGVLYSATNKTEGVTTIASNGATLVAKTEGNTDVGGTWEVHATIFYSIDSGATWQTAKTWMFSDPDWGEAPSGKFVCYNKIANKFLCNNYWESADGITWGQDKITVNGSNTIYKFLNVDINFNLLFGYAVISNSNYFFVAHLDNIKNIYYINIDPLPFKGPFFDFYNNTWVGFVSSNNPFGNVRLGLSRATWVRGYGY